MSLNMSAQETSAEIEKKMLSLLHLRTAIAADMPISLALVALSGAGVATPTTAAAASGLRAIAGHMSRLAAVVAVAAAETTTGSGLCAIARKMAGFAAVVAIAAATTTTTPTTTTLRAISRHVALLIAIVASHGSPTATAAPLTWFRTFPGNVSRFTAIVARTIAHFQIKR